MMLTKEKCLEALRDIEFNLPKSYRYFEYGFFERCAYVDQIEILKNLIYEHFSNPPLEFEERAKFLEKQLDIAIKDLCFTAKGSDACNSLDDLYEGIREKIEEQARKEVQE